MDIFFVNYKIFQQHEIEWIIKNFGNNYKSAKRLKEYSIARFLVRNIAEKFYKKNNLEISIKDKKPYFLNSKLHFSISHSNDIVLIAFDYENIGADIEFMKKRNFEKIFEYYKLNPIQKNAETFYRFWTEYEAEIKLQESPLSKISIKLLPDYMLSIASSHSFDIKRILRIYEVKRPTARTSPNELISLKLVNASNENENTVVIQEINTASLDFFDPLNLKTE